MLGPHLVVLFRKLPARPSIHCPFTASCLPRSEEQPLLWTPTAVRLYQGPRLKPPSTDHPEMRRQKKSFLFSSCLYQMFHCSIIKMANTLKTDEQAQSWPEPGKRAYWSRGLWGKSLCNRFNVKMIWKKKCIHIYFLIKGDIRNGEKSWDNEAIRAASQLFGASNFISSLIETTKGKKPEITLPFFVLSGQRENTHSDSESWISIPCIGVIPKPDIFSHINYTVDLLTGLQSYH